MPFNLLLYNVDLPLGSIKWSNIVKYQNCLREGVRWGIGDGKSVRFREDMCIGNAPLIFTKFSYLKEHNMVIMVSRFLIILRIIDEKP